MLPAVKSVLQLHGSTFWKNLLPTLQFPCKLWEVPFLAHRFGATSEQARAAAASVYRKCRGCLDKGCTTKILKLASCKGDLLPSAELGQWLSIIPFELTVANANEERDHAANRELLRSKKPRTLQTFACGGGLQQFAREQRRRGGLVPSLVVTSKSIVGSRLPTRATIEKKPKPLADRRAFHRKTGSVELRSHSLTSRLLIGVHLVPWSKLD